MATSAVSLYELGTQYKALLDTLAAGDFDAQTIADTIEGTGIIDDIEKKVEGYELVARSLEQFTPAIDAEIARLKALKEKRTGAAKLLREKVMEFFLAHGIEKVMAPRFTLALRLNPEAVDVFDERQIPQQFMTVPKVPDPVPNKTAIKAAIKAGQDVPGAKLTRSVRLDVQ